MIRRLNIGTFLVGIAVYATCSNCDAVFWVTDPDVLTDAQLAREKLISDFDHHQCTNYSVQSAP